MKTVYLVVYAVTLSVLDVRSHHISGLSHDHDELVIEEATGLETEPVVVPSETESILRSDLTEENSEKVSYRGHQLWKLTLDTKQKTRVVGNLRKDNAFSAWGGNHTSIDILVSQHNLSNVHEKLKENLIDYEVLLEDVQKAIDEQNPPIDEEEAAELEHRLGHRLSFNAYHRLSDIYGFLDYLATTYPSLCKVYVIGSSVQGRPLKVLKISNGKPGNKAVWVDGGIHAREWITPATVTYIINHFAHNLESEPQAIQNLDWYFFPVVNPDGYEYSHERDRLWRKNRARGGYCAGTDLNRNYGYKWGGTGGGRNPCQETYAGTGPFSEPETAALRNFIQGQNAQWKASVSYHSYGQYILYPWGYDRVVPPDHMDLQRVGDQAAQAMRQAGGASYRVGAAANTLYPASGGSDDWAKGVMMMKYTYTIELRDNGRYGFVLPASYIQPTAKEGLAALRVIGQAAAAA